jgi:hypothetical protein
MGGGLLNTRKVFCWNGQIACLGDAETHAVWGKLEPICLEAGGWTGWSSMLIKMGQVACVQPAYLSGFKCAGPGCSCVCSCGCMCLLHGDMRVCMHPRQCPSFPAAAVALGAPSTEAFLGNVLGCTATPLIKIQ